MSLISTEDLARWFGARAGQLLNTTVNQLARDGLAPVCITGSLAQNTGELQDRRGNIKPLPIVSHVSGVPGPLQERSRPFRTDDGRTSWVLAGDMGGRDSEQAIYELVPLAKINLHDVLVRVSCNGTTYRFTRYVAGWKLERIAA